MHIPVVYLGVEDRISSGGLQMLGIASKGMREEAEREEAAEAAARRRAEFLAAQMQRIKGTNEIILFLLTHINKHYILNSK